jgi:nucleoside-diphosphate-sugar epimerase
MKAFVTGGTGFIGRRLVRQLLARGDEVRVLARSPQSASDLAAAGAHIVPGDITDLESMTADMRGSDVVFHVAAWYKIGTADTSQARKINVDGTRNVLGLAYALGVPRIVYTSTVAVFGDTSGETVDEDYRADPGALLTEYDRTKWAAHYEVALPLIEQGAPIVIVLPGGVFGPGDTSIVGDLMRRFYGGRLPVLPGPETAITYAHVDDIVAGHLLAAEKGRVGESYILAGPGLTMGEFADLFALLTGMRAPRLRIPAGWLRPFAPLMGLLQQLVPVPDTFGGESLAMLGATYLARSDKARQELGWQPRPVEEGLADTLAWLADATPPGRGLSRRNKRLAAVGLAVAAGLVAVWLLSRRKGDR